MSTSFPSTGDSPGDHRGRSMGPVSHHQQHRDEHSRGRSSLVSGSGRKKKGERFFPDRVPRPSQMLNPEATWKVITNVIPSDLMDTLVRCYVSDSTNKKASVYKMLTREHVTLLNRSFPQVIFYGRFYTYQVSSRTTQILRNGLNQGLPALSLPSALCLLDMSTTLGFASSRMTLRLRANNTLNFSNVYAICRLLIGPHSTLFKRPFWRLFMRLAWGR